MFVFTANSSTPLKITSTDEGIRLYTFVSYYNDLLQVTWQHKWVCEENQKQLFWGFVLKTCFLSVRDSAIAFSDRIKSGVVGEQLWLQITDPTEKDMGKYAIEFNDGKGGLRRTVELSGQGENIACGLNLVVVERLICFFHNYSSQECLKSHSDHL